MNNIVPFTYRLFRATTTLSSRLVVRSFQTTTMHKAPAAKLTRPVAEETSIHQPRDPNTLSNYNAWRCQHVTANLDIDFEGKKVAGNVLLKLKKEHGSESKIVLDTRYVTFFYASSNALCFCLL